LPDQEQQRLEREQEIRRIVRDQCINQAILAQASARTTREMEQASMQQAAC
jgi:hypothetical protein